MKGFTLVELLAVVAIMATLSAIALPQYTKAVEKARATEGVVQAKAIRDGIIIHLQEFPDDPVNHRSQIAWVKIPNENGYSQTLYSTRYFEFVLNNNNVIVRRTKNGPMTQALYEITYIHQASGNWRITASEGCSDPKYRSACDLFLNR